MMLKIYQLALMFVVMRQLENFYNQFGYLIINLPVSK